MIESGSDRYVFMLWNLTLAVIPLFLAIWLKVISKNKLFITPKWLVIFGLWLVVLPNSFYMVTDLLHLRKTQEVSLIYDVILLESFIASGLILGLISLFLVHRVLQKHFSGHRSNVIMIIILALVSFAIYLGRYSRWNSWDLLFSPMGLIFDVSDQIVDPLANKSTYIVTILFFLFLSSIYWVVYELAGMLSKK